MANRTVIILPDADGKSPLTLGELQAIAPVKLIIVVTTSFAHAADKTEASARITNWARITGRPRQPVAVTSGDTIELALATVSAGADAADYVAVSVHVPLRARVRAENQVLLRWPGARRVAEISDDRLTVYELRA